MRQFIVCCSGSSRRLLLALLLALHWLSLDVSARFAVNPLSRHVLEQRLRSINSNIVWDKYNYLNSVAAHVAVCEDLLESEHQVGELPRDSLLRHLSAEQLDAWSHLYELVAFWDVAVLPTNTQQLDAELVASELERIVNNWAGRRLLNTGLPGTNTRDADDLLNRLRQAKAFGCGFDTCFVKQEEQQQQEVGGDRTRGVGAIVDSKTGAFESLDRMRSARRPYAVVLVCALG